MIYKGRFVWKLWKAIQSLESRQGVFYIKRCGPHMAAISVEFHQEMTDIIDLGKCK